jgi:NodT family efflux transporter outer membrane factor (OMF) lipoprotein
MEIAMRYQLPCQSLHGAKVSVITLAFIFGIGGCAQLPSSEQQATPKPIDSYQTSSSLSAPAISWPSEQWWRGYNDPQLNELIEEALRDSPDMAIASARLRRAEAFTQVSGAALSPQIGANGAVTQEKMSYNYLTPRAATPSGWNDYGVATLNFSWEIDFWGKNRAGLAAATSQLEASRAEHAQARLTLSAAVAANYAELARLFNERDLLLHHREIQTKSFHFFNERYTNGLENKGALYEAKARLAESEGSLLVNDEQIALQRNRLASLLGSGPDRGLAIKRPSVNLNNDYGFPSHLPVELLGRRPDVVAARLQTEAQLSRIEQKRAEFYPNVNLSAFIGVQAFGVNMLDNSGSSVGGVGPAISLPIFTAGRLRGELRGNVALYDETVATYNRTLTQALEEIASVGYSQRALTNELIKSEEAITASAEAHRVASNRYQGGLANYLEVLYTEDALLRAQHNHINLQSKTFSLDIALKRALGGGYQEKTSKSAEGNEHVRN